MKRKGALIQIFKEAGKPLKLKEIAERVNKVGLWRNKHETPTVEQACRPILSDIRRNKERSTFIRVERGVYWLRGVRSAAVCDDVKAPKLKNQSALSRPEETSSFVRDGKLVQQPGMKMEVVKKLAGEVGITEEDIKLVRQNPKDFQEWKAALSAQKLKPAFPERSSSNLDRRREELKEQMDKAPNKKYEKRRRNVRTTKEKAATASWLRSQYKNEDNQMVCQVCKKEMPFIKRDGEYYFEAVEALSRDHFPKEHKAQFLALCPVCAAMYNEFIKQDEGAMVNMKNALMDSEKFEVPLRLGEKDTSIRFVETHYYDIKMVIEISRSFIISRQDAS